MCRPRYGPDIPATVSATVRVSVSQPELVSELGLAFLSATVFGSEWALLAASAWE
jgi:hypothetical protein